MAYLANNPEDERKNETPGMNVVQGAAGSAQDQANQGAAGPGSAGAAAGGAVGSTSQRQAQASKGAEKAGSGRFVGIKSYLEANKPGGQQMSAAVAKTTGDKAAQISQQVQAKEAQTKQILDQNKAKLGEASTFATGQIDQIMAPEFVSTSIAPIESGEAAPTSNAYYTPGPHQSGYWTPNTVDMYPTSPTEAAKIDPTQLTDISGIDMEAVSKEYGQKMLGDKYDEYVSKIADLEGQEWAEDTTDKQKAMEELKGEYFTEDMTTFDKFLEEARSKKLEEDAKLMQQYMSGDYGQEEVGPFAVGEQQRKLDALAQLAESASREEGRSELLRESFGQDREYTRGQSALDAALLGGDPEVIGKLQEQLETAVGTESEKVSGIKEAILKQMAQAGFDEKETLEAIEGKITEADEALLEQQELEGAAQVEAFQQQQKEIKEAFQKGTITMDQMNLIDEGSLQSAKDSITRIAEQSLIPQLSSSNNHVRRKAKERLASIQNMSLDNFKKQIIDKSRQGVDFSKYFGGTDFDKAFGTDESGEKIKPRYVSEDVARRKRQLDALLGRGATSDYEEAGFIDGPKLTRTIDPSIYKYFDEYFRKVKGGGAK